jgi:hypothetical protein
VCCTTFYVQVSRCCMIGLTTPDAANCSGTSQCTTLSVKYYAV